MTPLIGPVDAPDLHVMTFNVRRRLRWTLRRADRWQHRLPLLQRLLRAERPDLLAAQELLPDQARAVREALDAAPGGAPRGRYRRIGHGRRPGPRGEASALFFDTARLDLIEWSQRALSDRPDEPGSRTWGNLFPRVFVEAAFRDRATGAEFFAIGTHFDVFSGAARRASAEAVRDRVAAQPRPAGVLGDLNAAPDSAPLQILRAGSLTDAWSAARTTLTPEYGTFAGYRAPTPGAARIDHILVTPDVEVHRIGIPGGETYGAWPSDHLPVQAVLRMSRKASP